MPKIAVHFFLLTFLTTTLFTPAKRATYTVKQMKSASFKFDGVLNDVQWTSCNVIKNFMSPWVKGARDYTVFRAFHDEEFFYFSYAVKDTSMTVVENADEGQINGEDRVEMFLSQMPDIKRYVGFEMDPQEKVMDYVVTYPGQFDFSWKADMLEVKTKKHSGGYELEGRLPLSFIRTMAIPEANPLSVYGGVFRADYYGPKTDDVTWFSWLKPASVTPNFHIPSSFGIFIFENAHKQLGR